MMLNTILRPIRQKVEVESSVLSIAAFGSAPGLYDYLCDGIDDEEQINAGVEALANGQGHSFIDTHWRWRWPWQPALVQKRGQLRLTLGEGTFNLSSSLVVPGGFAVEGAGTKETLVNTKWSWRRRSPGERDEDD